MSRLVRISSRLRKIYSNPRRKPSAIFIILGAIVLTFALVIRRLKADIILVESSSRRIPLRSECFNSSSSKFKIWIPLFLSKENKLEFMKLSSAKAMVKAPVQPQTQQFCLKYIASTTMQLHISTKIDSTTRSLFNEIPKLLHVLALIKSKIDAKNIKILVKKESKERPLHREILNRVGFSDTLIIGSKRTDTISTTTISTNDISLNLWYDPDLQKRMKKLLAGSNIEDDSYDLDCLVYFAASDNSQYSLMNEGKVVAKLKRFAKNFVYLREQDYIESEDGLNKLQNVLRSARLIIGCSSDILFYSIFSSVNVHVIELVPFGMKNDHLMKLEWLPCNGRNQKYHMLFLKRSGSLLQMSDDNYGYIQKIFSPSLQDNFETIYENRYWGKDGGGSGGGSSGEATKNMRAAMKTLFQKYRINSMMDAPCGAFVWTQLFVEDMRRENREFRYLGVDIVRPVIQKLQIKFADKNWINFSVRNVADVKLPEGFDIILSRDALQHMTEDVACRTLNNYLETNAKYLLIGSYHDVHQKKNSQLRESGSKYFPINVMLPPYSMPSPLTIIEEKGNYGDDPSTNKYLLLYDVQELRKNNFFVCGI